MVQKSISSFVLLLLVALSVGSAQSVVVKFRYYPQASYPRVHFPGTFTSATPSNTWGPNDGAGTIFAGAPSQADSLEASTGLWVKTYTLPFATYQYKVYRQLSTSPTNWSWISDPLNKVIVVDQNSQMVVDSLVLFQIGIYPYQIELAGQTNKFIAKFGSPSLTAGIFQPSGAPAPTIHAFIDADEIANPQTFFNAASGLFTYKPVSGIPDGIHWFKLFVSAGTNAKSDSIQFEVRARSVQIQTPPFKTRKPTYITAGTVLKPDGSGPDSSLSSVTLWNKGISKSVPATNGFFIDTTALNEGANIIRIQTANGADSVSVFRVVDHAPVARAQALFVSGGQVSLSASQTTDPDTQSVTNFEWFDDAAHPLGLNGKTGALVTAPYPATPGEYFYNVVAIDPDGNRDTTRTYFIVDEQGLLGNPSYPTNPSWVRQGRVYFLFPKAFTAAGTIAAAATRLTYIRDMGFNIIWMMPVMKNASTINQGTGPGYNITDFYNVAPEYGTNQDFKNFVAAAHGLGIKVILDVTPNHSSRSHPWSADAHTNGIRSPYWNWYQHTIIPHGDNGLGQSLDADGFNYYSGFSDQLLNLNWADIDLRSEMINVYSYWIREFGLDGYRFDVYWGPHRRYGEVNFGMPLRTALKKLKPDILLLGEDDGTGFGTEGIYADYLQSNIRGGLDAAYDFQLFFNAIRNFQFSSNAIDNLDAKVNNGAFFPGPNSLYMRFMEDQDEDRIFYTDPSQSTYYDPNPTVAFQKTMPMASVLFTIPGLPTIWNGQEVGWGYGIAGNKLARNRSTINFGFQGRTLLTPHYERLARIRGSFAALANQAYVRVASGNSLAYTFVRQHAKKPAVVAVNFSASPISGQVTLSNATLGSSFQNSVPYYASDVFTDSSVSVQFSSGSVTIPYSLPPYGTSIIIVSDSIQKVTVPTITSADEEQEASVPSDPMLYGAYPNPFNPSTTIRYSIPSEQYVRIEVYDLLGRSVETLVSERKPAGIHEVRFGATGLPSGLYFCTIKAGEFTKTQKLLLVK